MVFAKLQITGGLFLQLPLVVLHENHVIAGQAQRATVRQLQANNEPFALANAGHDGSDSAKSVVGGYGDPGSHGLHYLADWNQPSVCVDQLVIRQARVRRDMLIRRRGPRHAARLGVHIIVPLRRPLDAVGPVQPRVEPLRTVRRRHLGRQHVTVLVEERPRVLLAAEVAALPAPVGPAARQPAEHLPGVGLLAGARIIRGRAAALQPARHARFRHALGAGRHTGFAEVFLCQNVHGDLRPALGRQQVGHFKDHRSIGVGNARAARHEAQGSKGFLSFDGVVTRNMHKVVTPCNYVGVAP